MCQNRSHAAEPRFLPRMKSIRAHALSLFYLHRCMCDHILTKRDISNSNKNILTVQYTRWMLKTLLILIIANWMQMKCKKNHFFQKTPTKLMSPGGNSTANASIRLLAWAPRTTAMSQETKWTSFFVRSKG